MIVTIEVSKDFLYKNRSEINWNHFVKTNEITTEIIDIISDMDIIDRELSSNISQFIDINNFDLLSKCSSFIDWSVVTYRAVNTKLMASTCQFVKKFKSKLDWNAISQYQNKMTNVFVTTYLTYLNWNIISYSDLSCKTFKKCAKYMNWNRLVTNYDLSIDELYDLKDFIPWDLVAKYQFLEEVEIEELSTMINWIDVSRYQVLSADFIKKYRDALSFDCLLQNQNLISIQSQIYKIYDKDGVDVVEVESSVNNICPICRDCDGTFYKIKCNHVFHKECILSWTERIRSCPMCREKL